MVRLTLLIEQPPFAERIIVGFCRFITGRPHTQSRGYRAECIYHLRCNLWRGCNDSISYIRNLLLYPAVIDEEARESSGLPALNV